MAYASKYYDPVKAHEYYMKHRELKGRKSTTGLNATGKEAAKYVKDKLQEERNAKVESLKSQVTAQVDDLKSAIERIREGMKQQRESIKKRREAIKQESERIKNMPDGPAKDRAKESLQKKKDILKQLREGMKRDNEKNRKTIADIRNDVKSIKKSFSESKKKIKEEYDNKYIQELDKLKADAGMQAKKKKG